MTYDNNHDMTYLFSIRSILEYYIKKVKPRCRNFTHISRYFLCRTIVYCNVLFPRYSFHSLWSFYGFEENDSHASDRSWQYRMPAARHCRVKTSSRHQKALPFNTRIGNKLDKRVRAFPKRTVHQPLQRQSRTSSFTIETLPLLLINESPSTRRGATLRQILRSVL